MSFINNLIKNNLILNNTYITYENIKGLIDVEKNIKEPEIIENEKQENKEENKPEIIQQNQIYQKPIQEFSDNWRMATQLAK